uniref:Uncharacterized protein n=1 Tax=Anguilla anguilla TaxID=7936 RepID=A0A0E9PDB8_ANGAN
MFKALHKSPISLNSYTVSVTDLSQGL